MALPCSDCQNCCISPEAFAIEIGVLEVIFFQEVYSKWTENVLTNKVVAPPVAKTDVL